MTRNHLGSIVLPALALAGAFSAPPAHAQAYEPFAYTAGSDVDGQTGGTGFADRYYASNATVVSGSLMDPTGTLVTGGNSIQTSGSNYAFRALSSGYGTPGTSVYIGFLTSLAGGYDSSASAGIKLGNLLNIGQQPYAGGNYGFTFNFGANSQSGGGNINNGGNTDFLVYRIDFGTTTDGSASTGTQNQISLYVNPTPGSTPGTPALTSVFDNNPYDSYNGQGTVYHPFTFDNFTISSTNGESVNFDELRFGSTFADVAPIAAPEPSSLAALLIACVGLSGLALRARRRSGAAA